MATYLVKLERSGNTIVESVEARSQDEAKRKAERMAEARGKNGYHAISCISG